MQDAMHHVPAIMVRSALVLLDNLHDPASSGPGADMLVIGAVKLFQRNASDADIRRAARVAAPAGTAPPASRSRARARVSPRRGEPCLAGGECPPRRRRSMTGPFILIIVGIIFLLGEPAFDLVGPPGSAVAHYWPLLLILWGVLKLIEHQRAKQEG